MLNSLGLATEGFLEGGDSPTLSLATAGFIFIEVITLFPSFIPSGESFGALTLTKVGLLITPITIPTDAFVESPLVVGGGNIIVPIPNRKTFNTVAKYLRDLIFKGQDNEVIIAWFKSEGLDKGAYNDLWHEYLLREGYIGNLADKYAAWKSGE
jgi:hypothetical protein